ncbi:DUF4019 domain-containing protein [Variovorax paradoxus]|uniref:DUF4019 domain-containing protein n=1 Tax=Variovorax paradoxus TaxID=34073 RepID=UPI00247FD6EA|nr:DUF4019 domain-containing protein [Variovorax paradoxus]WGT65308.1 DUF4019 domain-containing protein [Variovorax paradoxus]
MANQLGLRLRCRREFQAAMAQRNQQTLGVKMTLTKRLLLGAAMFAGCMGLASAQEADPTNMVRGGLQVIQMVDQGKVGELWDGAAPAAKKRVTRSDFIQQVSQARSPLGAAQQRIWVAVNRQTVANEDADVAGQYVNVEYETRFANAANRVVREMTTFRLDRDGSWRLSGYVLR